MKRIFFHYKTVLFINICYMMQLLIINCLFSSSESNRDNKCLNYFYYLFTLNEDEIIIKLIDYFANIRIKETFDKRTQ